ncbi:uncharacterized protein [Rutidosis leptorrhynchoides]|uniref:uncharacterized protein n=1 Tax=Rutidosis leptorrhynchoides TaxID=125765 RepID=UPI003A98E9EE
MSDIPPVISLDSDSDSSATSLTVVADSQMPSSTPSSDPGASYSGASNHAPAPVANGQCEVTNRDIVKGIKALLGSYGNEWVVELPSVLWVHRTTHKNSAGETPFSLVYGTEAIIPAEILVPTKRVQSFDESSNGKGLHTNLDMLKEHREIAAIREVMNKKKISKYYDKHVKPLSFKVGEYVWCNNEASRAENTGKLGPNWEGPYEIIGTSATGSYILAEITGERVPRIRHATNLKRYYI